MLDQEHISQAISRLLCHGPVTAEAMEPWFDYVGHYGLTVSDIPDLVSLSQGAHSNQPLLSDDEVAIHACRALGQLGDAQATTALVQRLDANGDDRLIENALVALSLLGPKGLDALKRFLVEPENSVWSRIEAAAGCRIFAQRNPPFREECVSFLSDALAEGTPQAAMLNGFIVFNLIELKATEAAEVISQAFQADCVDEDVSGRWPDVQIQLGLAKVTDFEPDALMYAGELYPFPEEPEQVETSAALPQQTRPILFQGDLAESYSIAEHLTHQKK